MLTVSRFGKDMYFDQAGFDTDPYVYQPIADGRVYEEEYLTHIRELGRRGTYLDVGAHLGTHTVWFAVLCPSTRVHAFEPVGQFAQVVQRNIAANNLGGKVTLHQVGLSDRRGQATNRLGPDHWTGFTADYEAVDETFPVVRLDDVISRREPVVLIKLDVEGMEASVLRGARRILSRWRPVVFAEAFTDADVAEIDAVLRPFGYRRTDRVFNPTPTYEFIAPARIGLARRLLHRGHGEL